MNSSVKIKLGQIEEIKMEHIKGLSQQLGVKSPLIKPLNILQNTCGQGIPKGNSRLININALAFCIQVTKDDLDSEIRFTNYSKTPLPIESNSSKVYKDFLLPESVQENYSYLSQFEPKSWYTLRVTQQFGIHYFLVVESGTI